MNKNVKLGPKNNILIEDASLYSKLFSNITRPGRYLELLYWLTFLPFAYHT